MYAVDVSFNRLFCILYTRIYRIHLCEDEILYVYDIAYIYELEWVSGMGAGGIDIDGRVRFFNFRRSNERSSRTSII